MDIKKYLPIIVSAAILITAYCIGWLVGDNHGQHRWDNAPSDTTHTVVYDTTTIYHPVPVDSFVVRYVYRTLPVAPRDGTVVVADTNLFMSDNPLSAAHNCPDSLAADSAAVIIPITQKVYHDSLYTAYVSGYEPSLDSISLRLPTHTYNIHTHAPVKRKPWGIGVQVGYGVGRNVTTGRVELTPYVGIGISYNIFDF